MRYLEQSESSFSERYASFYQAYRPAVRKHAEKYSWLSPVDRDEVTDESHFRYYKFLASGEADPFGNVGYLWRIVKNLAYEYGRRKGRHGGSPSSTPDSDSGDHSGGPETSDPRSPNMFSMIEAHGLWCRLPRFYREVVRFGGRLSLLRALLRSYWLTETAGGQSGSPSRELECEQFDFVDSFLTRSGEEFSRLYVGKKPINQFLQDELGLSQGAIHTALTRFRPAWVEAKETVWEDVLVPTVRAKAM